MLIHLQRRGEAQLHQLPATRRNLRLQHSTQLGRPNKEERGWHSWFPGNILRRREQQWTTRPRAGLEPWLAQWISGLASFVSSELLPSALTGISAALARANIPPSGASRASAASDHRFYWKSTPPCGRLHFEHIAADNIMARNDKHRRLSGTGSHTDSATYELYWITLSIPFGIQLWKSWATAWCAESKWSFLADATTNIKPNLGYGEVAVQRCQEDAIESSKRDVWE
jgi:hypothetical protein